MTNEKKLFNESWPKNCSCGHSYDEHAWERLRYVGCQPSGLDGVPDLELRSCERCKSTLAIAVTADFI